MKWLGRRGSSNVEDRRGGGGIYIGGISGVIILLLFWLLGGNPIQLLDSSQQGGEYGTSATLENDTLAQFVSVVLADTEEVWTNIFNEMGKTYRKPTLVIYNDVVSSACGTASKATGPFYCPGDEKIYIDLSFYQEMTNNLHASGDFAFAYTIAHEVGHHVQKLLGTMDQVDAIRARSDEREQNRLSVRLELQADFYAGVWANHEQSMFNSLDNGDIDEALNAASAIGDDRLQQEAQGYVVPDSFTHGTSEQRHYWFKKGYDTGDISQGNTFDPNSF